MSTKIYQGFKIPNYNRLELKEFIKGVQEEIQEIHYHLYQKLLSGICENILDLRYLNPEAYIEKINDVLSIDVDGNNYPYFIALREIKDRKKEVTNKKNRDPFIDFDCEMVLFYLEDKILLQLFTEQESFKEVINNHKDVEYYGYWDNADPDEEVSDMEWKQRGKDWNVAMGETWIPALEGQAIKCTIDEIIFPNRDEILKNIRPFEERVKKNAENELITKFISESLKEDTENINVMRMHINANNYLKSEKGKIDLKIEEKRIKKLLPTKYTKGDLSRNLKDFMVEKL